MVSSHLRFMIPGGVCVAGGGLCLLFGLLFLMVSKLVGSAPTFILMIIWITIPIGIILLVIGIIFLAKGLHDYNLKKY